MKTILKQSIEHSLTENFKIYSDDYPMQEANGGIYPTEGSICMLVNWIENEYKNSEEENKGAIEEWFEIAKQTFYDHWGLSDGDYDETGSTWNYLNETVNQFRKEGYFK